MRQAKVCSKTKHFSARLCFCSNIEIIAHPKQAKKKGASAKASASTAATMKAPLGESSSSINAGEEGRSIEQIYQKKTQLEHILLRPDTYSK